MKLPKLDRNISILFLVTFFVGMSLGMTAPILPDIRSEFNLTYSTAALILSSFGFARLILALPSGYLYGRVEKKYLLALGIIALAAGSLLAGFSATFIQFLLSQIIMGAGFSLCLITIIITLSTSSTSRNRGSVLGMNTFSRTVASVISPAIAGFVTIVFDWRHVFFAYTIISVLSLFIVLAFMKKEKEIAVKEEESASYFNPAIISIFFAIFATFFVGAGFRNTLMPLFGKDVLGMNPAAIGMVLSVSALVYLLAGPSAAFLSDRHGRKFFLSLGLLLTAIGLFSFIFVSDINQLYVLSVILGFGAITYVIPVAMIGDMTLNAKKDFSIMRLVSELGFVVGPIVLGIIADYYGFSAAAILAGILTIISLICIEIFVKEPRHRLNWKKVLQLEED